MATTAASATRKSRSTDFRATRRTVAGHLDDTVLQMFLASPGEPDAGSANLASHHRND